MWRGISKMAKSKAKSLEESGSYQIGVTSNEKRRRNIIM